MFFVTEEKKPTPTKPPHQHQHQHQRNRPMSGPAMMGNKGPKPLLSMGSPRGGGAMGRGGGMGGFGQNRQGKL